MMSEYLLQPPHSVGISIPDVAPTSVEQDDAILVAASKAGDQNAFAVLVQRHQRRVFNLVYRLLQEYDEANEVTQDAFFSAWQGLPSFRGDARFSTWLYRIAYNYALKQLEKRKRDKALEVAMQVETETGDERVEEAIEVHQRQEIVREHLSMLPAKYQIVLILRHLQEMTYEEMAEILRVPIGTIKTHLFRARNLLKERLEAFEHEWKTRG
jgi:RNA polymerase sigma-70 factor (ECF subfamily)